jgi:hypothetical protein
MNEELITLVLRELGKYQDRKRVIRNVCKQSGLRWKDAERLVILVEAQRNRTRTVNANPWLLLLSIGTLFAGIGLLAFNLPILMALFHKDILRQAMSLPVDQYKLIAGAGITGGGLIALWKAFQSIFPD